MRANAEHPESDSDSDCDAQVAARCRLAPQACGNAGPLLPRAMLMPEPMMVAEVEEVDRQND